MVGGFLDTWYPFVQQLDHMWSILELDVYLIFFIWLGKLSLFGYTIWIPFCIHQDSLENWDLYYEYTHTHKYTYTHKNEWSLLECTIGSGSSSSIMLVLWKKGQEPSSSFHETRCLSALKCTFQSEEVGSLVNDVISAAG